MDMVSAEDIPNIEHPTEDLKGNRDKIKTRGRPAKVPAYNSREYKTKVARKKTALQKKVTETKEMDKTREKEMMRLIDSLDTLHGLHRLNDLM